MTLFETPSACYFNIESPQTLQRSQNTPLSIVSGRGILYSKIPPQQNPRSAMTKANHGSKNRSAAAASMGAVTRKLYIA